MHRVEKLRQHIDGILLHIQDDEERRCAYIHLYGVAQACALLALRRGLDVELAAIAGMLHDLSAHQSMVLQDHARHSARLAEEILAQLGIATAEEIAAVSTAIRNHSDKLRVDAPLDELLKDADVLQHALYNTALPLRESNRPRYQRLAQELGLDGQPEPPAPA
ncbi:MAG: HD domain-containing protein [Anaerolineae bacterium]